MSFQQQGFKFIAWNRHAEKSQKRIEFESAIIKCGKKTIPSIRPEAGFLLSRLLEKQIFA